MQKQSLFRLNMLLLVWVLTVAWLLPGPTKAEPNVIDTFDFTFSGVTFSPGRIAVNTMTDKAYVLFNTGVVVVNGATNQVEALTPLTGATHGNIAVSTVTNRIYVSTGQIVDGATNAVVGTLPTGPTRLFPFANPRLVVSESFHRIYTNGDYIAATSLMVQRTPSPDNFRMKRRVAGSGAFWRVFPFGD